MIATSVWYSISLKKSEDSLLKDFQNKDSLSFEKLHNMEKHFTVVKSVRFQGFVIALFCFMAIMLGIMKFEFENFDIWKYLFYGMMLVAALCFCFVSLKAISICKKVIKFQD